METTPKEAYPAVHHIGIVVARDFGGHEALAAVLRGHEVVEPLHEGQRSRSGAYATLRVSVRVESRQRLEQLDNELRAVPGVRMLL